MRRRPRQTLDVGGQRRIVFTVIGGVIADDVDHRRRGFVGVVDVGEPVGETRAEMQQGRGRLFAHPGIPVRGSGDDPLEQAEHAAHAINPVEGCDKMHLRGAGIGEAHIDPAPHQSTH